MFPYQRFTAWQVSHELVLAVYQATQAWPKHELYGLTSQTRRSAYSITMNLVEGSAKRGPREFRRFLDISIGSTAELSYCLLLARDLNLLPEDKWSKLEELRNRAGQLLWRLYQAVGKRTQTSA
jgi:four helix bundle protein